MREIRVACLVAIVVAGCSSYNPAAVAPTAPSPVPPAVVVPSVTSPVFPGYTLTQVRLTGVVFELTAVGDTPIANVPVYCEPCGQLTHTWAYTNARGVYEFPSDPTIGAASGYLLVSSRNYVLPKKVTRILLVCRRFTGRLRVERDGGRF